MIFSISLAWLQLIHSKVRFLATLAGIAFVVVLLLMQLGFQEALFESSVRVHKSLQADLYIVSPQYQSLTAQQEFPRTRLYQALAIEGVESISPLYFNFGKLKNIINSQKSSIFVFGIDPDKPTFDIPEVNQNLDKLKLPDVALFDRDSRLEFGPVAAKFEEEGNLQVEISSFGDIILANKIEIQGLFNIGPSFGVDGNIITSSSTFLRTFKDRQAENIDLGLITLEPNADIEEVRNSLVHNLPHDITIFTEAEFIALEKAFWDLRTPIGFVFRTMVIMGFVVGIGITYQILYGNVSNHVVAYATLKAIGFANRYLSNTVFKQALLLAILGYIPGMIIAVGLYSVTYEATRLPIIMTLNKALTVLISMIFMCTVSGIMAIQKLRSADPADIFG